MKRLPALAFAALAAATVLAFFLTQHLKTAPALLVEKNPRPVPIPADFNPVAGRKCVSRTRGLLDYRHTSLTLAMPRAGTISVSVVNGADALVATLPSRTLGSYQPSTFVWRGYENGGRLAPDGTYFFQLELVQQQRTITLNSPVQVKTSPPHPVVTRVTLNGAPASKASGPVILTPSLGAVTVHFKFEDYRRVWVDVYRTDVAGGPRLVYHFKPKHPASGTAVWEGNLRNGSLAPAGTYLIGLKVQDMACNKATFPVVPSDPAPGTTPGAGVTVRYLSASPPLTATRAGGSATVAVDSPTAPYSWALRLAGRGKVLERGAGPLGDGELRVPLPNRVAGLYTLTLAAGTYSTTVPLVAHATGARNASARVLVVLPMLTWQGENPVDDTGDGLPATLAAGEPVSLDRPFVDGLPPGFRQDVALLSYLNAQHFKYQVTTDVALAQGVGPSLVDRWGVVLAGSERWLPSTLVQGLHRFVSAGGRVLSLGTGSLTGRVQISGYPSDPVASAPTVMHTDPFGAVHGPLTSTGGELVTEVTDPLDLLRSSYVLTGFSHFDPIEPPAGAVASLAGIGGGQPAVAAFKLGQGYVVEVGLANFNTTLAGNIDSQDLLSSIWPLLAK